MPAERKYCQKWCTDFTYLFLENHEVRYNCTIIDLHDTSKAFVEFCESVHVTQSMSKAGYPYDNAPMEGYFNTLKSELIYLYEYDAEEALYQARIALMRYDARMDCLSTSYRECSAYVKDKAAKGGAKHPLHTRNTPVISK